MPDQGQMDVVAGPHNGLDAQALPLADAALAVPAATAGHPPTSPATDTLRADSFAAFTSTQTLDGRQVSGNDLRLSSFGGFAAGSVSTLSTGGALADLATAVAAQDGSQAKTVQQLKHLRHLHIQQSEQRSPRSIPVPSAGAALADALLPPPSMQRASDSMLSGLSAGSDLSGRSECGPGSSSPLVRPKAIRPAARQNSAPHAAGSMPTWLPGAPSSNGGSSPGTAKAAAPPPPLLRSAASAPDHLQLSPSGLPSGRSSPRQLSPTGGVAHDGGGGASVAPVDRKGTASAPLINRSSSVSSGEVCNLAAAAALSEVPSGHGTGLLHPSRGHSTSPQFGAAEAAFRALPGANAPAPPGASALQMPPFIPRPSTPPTLAARSPAASAAAWAGREHMTAMELGSMPGSLEALAAQWQVDFAVQQAAADKRLEDAAAMQRQDAILRQQQEAAAAARQQHMQQRQQQDAAARLHHHLQQQQQQQQRDALAYLSAAQLQQAHPGASHRLQGGNAVGGGLWPDGVHSAALQQQQQAQNFGPGMSLPPAHSPPDMLRQLAAAQQGGWGTAAGGNNSTPAAGPMPPTGLPFGADPQLASSLHWYELQRQQRQQEADRQQQEQFARLLFAAQQQNAAQQQLLRSMREGMAAGGSMQGAHPNFRAAGSNINQLAASAPTLTASMQTWMQQQPMAASIADGLVANGGAFRKRSSSGELDPPAKRPSGDGAPRANGQVCAQCGESNTPTWRRAGGQLLCNACGLRRYRAMARSNREKAGASGSPPSDAGALLP